MLIDYCPDMRYMMVASAVTVQLTAVRIRIDLRLFLATLRRCLIRIHGNIDCGDDLAFD